MSPLKSRNCVKCPDDGGVIVLNKKDVYCRPCFLHYVSHRFRSTLGKQKICKFSQKVLVMISGGASSLALLDLIRQSLSTQEQKRIKIEPTVIHLVENFDRNCAEFIDRLKSYEFPVLVYRLADVLYSTSENLVQFSTEQCDLARNENEENLHKLLMNVKSRTSQLDLYKRLKTFSYIRIARHLNTSYVLVGDNCSNLSSSMLADVGQGRGGQIKDGVSVLDKRWADVTVIRLLCELQNKEVAYYNYFRGILSDYHYHPVSYQHDTSSIQHETREFVEDLQSQFPSTICTLFSTASKLAVSKTTNADGSEKCSLCSSPVDRDESSRDKINDKDCLQNFCYGCQITIKETDSFQTLLPAILLK